jgi:hypothetical protein
MKHELRQLLDESARKILVTILPVPPVARKKLEEDEVKLIAFLESSLYLAEEDVSPLIEVVHSAKEASLNSILNVLNKYQDSKLSYTKPHGK